MVAIFSKIIANRRSGAVHSSGVRQPRAPLWGDRACAACCLGAVQSDDFLQKIIDFRYKDEVDGSGKVVKEGRGFTDSEVAQTRYSGHDPPPLLAPTLTPTPTHTHPHTHTHPPTLPTPPHPAPQVTGWLIVLLFAGQHTSSITATWLGAMLLSNKEAMADCLAEQRARARGHAEEGHCPASSELAPRAVLSSGASAGRGVADVMNEP